MKQTWYFYPSLGRTIFAFTREEADKIAAGELEETKETPEDIESKMIDPKKVNNRGIPRRISNK